MILDFLSRLVRGPNGLSPKDFVARREASHPVLDVRTASEFAQEHLKGAINVDVSAPDFARQVERLAKKGKLKTDEPVYLYCRSGARSGRATRLLRHQGYGQAYNVGGIGGLKRAGSGVGR
jgi:rhodanese-related sulfurtransferase